MRIKTYYLLKMCFQPHYHVCLAKNQETWNFGKIRKYDEERVFFRGKNDPIF